GPDRRPDPGTPPGAIGAPPGATCVNARGPAAPAAAPGAPATGPAEGRPATAGRGPASGPGSDSDSSAAASGTGSYPQSASSAAPTARPVSITRPSSQTSTVRAVMLRCTQPWECSTRSAIRTSAATSAARYGDSGFSASSADSGRADTSS